MCIILFWIFLLQNYIFDYPNRLRDIVGNWVSLFFILIYLWGIFVGVIRYSNTGTGIFVYVNLIPLIVFLVIRYTLKKLLVDCSIYLAKFTLVNKVRKRVSEVWSNFSLKAE